MLFARRLVLVLVALALLMAVVPASAQHDPEPPIGPRPDPSPPEEPHGPCLPVGLALAVLSTDGTIADILPETQPDANTGSGVRTIILNGPGVVGACAAFQGFWSPHAAGTAVTELELFLLAGNSGANVADKKLVARDGLKLERRGPYQHGSRMAARTKLEKPGRYQFVAELSVSATPADSAAVVGKTVEDSLKVPFNVEVRSEQPHRTGAIEGFVFTLKNGVRHPLAGAKVAAMPAVALTVPKQAALQVPLRSSSLGDAGSAAAGYLQERNVVQARLSDTLRAETDERGFYRLEVPAGAYVVMAAAPGYKTLYFDNRDDRRSADQVKVAAGTTTGGINFALLMAEEPKPPEHPVYGAISGHVGGEGADHIKGAVVYAVPVRRNSDPGERPLGDADPNPGPGTNLAARTDEHGSYKMMVPVGEYTVVAHAEGYARQWYEGKESPEGADIVGVKPDNTTEGIDFKLVKADPPRDPEPPDPNEHGVISGRAFGPDGPIAGALVGALPPASDDVPPERPDPLFGEPAPGLDPSRPVARTDEHGAYVLHVPVGKWILRAEAEGFSPMFYAKGDDTDQPTVFKVKAGDKYEGIDFHMLPMEETAIKGFVTGRGAERGIEGIAVWAIARPMPDNPGIPVQPPVRVRTLTKEDGTFVLYVPAGTYAVGVVLHPEQSDPDKAAMWWNNKRKLEDADLITLGKGEVFPGVTFHITNSGDLP